LKGKNKKEMEGGKIKKIKKKKRENKKEIKRGKGIIDILPSYLLFAVRRSCFVKCFSSTDSPPPQNLLHQHSYNQSCHSHSQSPAEHTLYFY
jgi:hypothetical protein